jgi:hypothetical protein
VRERRSPAQQGRFCNGTSHHASYLHGHEETVNRIFLTG